ncbi:increased DNA methylation 1-like [Andrographis paniculata]|uniref:increased DNA methylation 1-like n=1 Tax=Andrographis paniculata TaxID=175694 RepID=UPI0021E7693E|nr:increased DNA methylation 1-like [Andrographis paniculata]
MICEQCEREFHVGCLRKKMNNDLRALPEHKWFCGAQCKKIHSTLQTFVAKGDLELPETVGKILKKKFKGKASKPSQTYSNMKWRILKPNSNSEDNGALLTRVKTILEEQFPELALRKVDGSLDERLIHTMVFGEKIDRHDFFGMHSAVLMIKSEIVCVGIFRVFGEEVAELPLVATEKDNEKKGYCKALLLCMEDLLSTLQVKTLILPSASSMKAMWKRKFWFKNLKKKQLEKYTDNYQKIMPFEDTIVLHKLIHKS